MEFMELHLCLLLFSPTSPSKQASPQLFHLLSPLRAPTQFHTIS